MFTRRGFISAAAGAAIVPGLQASGRARTAQGLRIAMTAAELPTAQGIPNNGAEGVGFLGDPAYDSIVDWDFTHTDKLADITPGLFTASHADETKQLRWIC